MQNLLSDISWDKQETLINNTVNFPLVLTYPLKLQYQKAFIKLILEKLEKKNAVVHDTLYESYGRLVSLADHERECFKHYETPAKILTFKENSSIISSGTTGLCSWQVLNSDYEHGFK